ncbi:MAG: YHS domain-containing (seleno)protein, partial [Beijerinckiaceae bacterium]
MLSRRLFLSVISLSAMAGLARAQTRHFTDIVKGVAVGGYDPVAYFTNGKPLKGSSAIVAEHEGAVWRFASAENRAAFLADP